MNVHKKFFSKIGFNYLALGITAIVFQMIIVNIISITNPDYLSDYNILCMISSLCNYILPFPVFYWLMKRLESFKLEKNKPTAKTFALYLGITFTLMWIGNMIGLGITAILSSTIQTDISNPVHKLINNTDILFNLIVISIIAPIFEEFLFRKMLIDRSIKYGARVSIVLSAVLFGLFHGNLNQFFYAALIGGFFAYVYIKTGKLIYPIILHAFVNLMGSVVSLILANAIINLETSINSFDLTIALLYLVVCATLVVLGIVGLSRYKKAKFNGEKTKISLKYPYKTLFMNLGMICFVVFFIFETIMQAIP